jgi:phospholipase C
MAGTTDSYTVTAVQIYVDNVLVYQVNANAVNTYIPLATGNHLVTVQGWDTTGRTFKTNVKMSMTPPCALKTTNQTVTICTPGNSATVSSPLHLVAGITDSKPVISIQVLADGTQVYSNSGGSLDVFVKNLTAGNHSLMVKAHDSAGATFSSSVPISTTSNSGLSNIRHIIFFVQENRSFDNYFGMLGRYRVSRGLPNNIDGIPLNATLYDTQGQPVHPFHSQTVCAENLSPFWNETHLDIDGGKMDGFMQTSTSVPSTIDPTGTRAMGYYDQTDLPYYYELATQFATSDRFFSSVDSNTNANRMYLFAGTSFGHVRPDTPPPGDAAKLAPIANWAADLQNEAGLPSVVFIERAGPSGLDEHPGNNAQLGAVDVANILNKLLASPSWASSVFILTYDEGGGLFDHVMPANMVKPDGIAPILQAGDQPGKFDHAGFRVPIVVVSPWVKPHYVSHTWRDLTSILRLIETRFNVAGLTARDSNADNMMEFFDFSNSYWLNPPPLPTQPTNGTCNYSLEKAPGF